MKKRFAILTLAAIILVGGGYATYEYTRYDRTPGLPPLRISTRTPERIILKTDGPPGQHFSAILTVDGSRREVSGVTPAEFPLECVVLVGEVMKFDGEGSFSLMIERQNRAGRCFTPPVKTLRRFRYYDGTLGFLSQK